MPKKTTKVYYAKDGKRSEFVNVIDEDGKPVYERNPDGGRLTLPNGHFVPLQRKIEFTTMVASGDKKSSILTISPSDDGYDFLTAHFDALVRNGTLLDKEGYEKYRDHMMWEAREKAKLELSKDIKAGKAVIDKQRQEIEDLKRQLKEQAEQGNAK